MTTQGKFWLLAFAACVLFWWLVIESVIRLALWVGAV